MTGQERLEQVPVGARSFLIVSAGACRRPHTSTWNFRFFLVGLALLFGFVSLQPQLSAQAVSNPRAEKILQETLAALGGDALNKIRTTEERGRAYSFRRGRLSGLAVIRQVTRYPEPSEFPDRNPVVLERQYLGKDEEISSLVLYDKLFDITYRGYVPAEEEITDRVKESRLHNFFYIALQRLPREKYLYEYIGTRLLRNQQLVGIRLIDQEDRVTELWVHQTTKLPVRQEFVRRDPKTNLPIEEVTEWDKFREVSGVQWPMYVLRESRGQKSFEMFTATVTINPATPESTFELPNPEKRARDKR